MCLYPTFHICSRNISCFTLGSHVQQRPCEFVGVECGMHRTHQAYVCQSLTDSVIAPVVRSTYRGT